jgi:hypothetical protein
MCTHLFIYLPFNDVNNSEYTGSKDIGSMNNEFLTMCKHPHSVLSQSVVLSRHRSHSTTHQALTASLLLSHHPAVFDSCYRAIFVGLTAVLWVLTAIYTYKKLLPFRGSLLPPCSRSVTSTGVFWILDPWRWYRWDVPKCREKKYRYTLRNNPEERGSHLLRGGTWSHEQNKHKRTVHNRKLI